MNRRSFTSLLLPILSLGLIKSREKKPVTIKLSNFDGKPNIIDFSGTDNNGKWIVYSLDC